jgi:hypothetical protein
MQRHASEAREHEDDPTGIAQESAGNDTSDITFGEFDRLTLVDYSEGYHSDEEYHSVEEYHSDEELNEAGLLQDPYSTLSPLQREITVQFYNNAPLFPDGVPIRAIFQGVNQTTVGGYEISEIW